MPKKQKPATREFILVERPYKKIAITFLVLAGLLVCVISYFSLSKAVITLIPKDAAREKTFTATVPLASAATAELSGTYIEKDLNITKTFDVQNFKTEEGKSGGAVKIINKNTKNQTLIATTRFLSPNNLLFRLKNSVVVPAGGEIIGEIEADEAGAKYDIAPTTFTIPGLSTDLQKKIYGVSSQVMSGGVRKIGTLTAAEIATAQKTVLDSLDESIIKEIGADESKTVLFEKEIKDEKISAKDGDKVEKFTVTIKVKVQAAIIAKDKILEYAKTEYNKTLAEKEEVVNFDLKSFKVSLVDIAKESATVKITLSAAILGLPEPSEFNKQKLYGLDAKGVRFFFSQYENIKDAEVVFSPFWVKTVPSLADHVEIRIKQ
ncbi:MAG: hypothetical protein PHT40_00395 [Patescibacteria group bacterium]|nr:hypothetical protein [Patescibacteria group bacterium]